MAMVLRDKPEISTYADLVGIVERWDPLGCRKDMDPEAAERMLHLLFQATLAGYGLLKVACGRRTILEQERLYGRGRTAGQLAAQGIDPMLADSGKMQVTWTLPSKSKHIDGRAWDLDITSYGGVHLKRLGRIANHLGITWGGSWRKKDYGHFEI